ncbi:MAG TPA: hypothetical protein PKY05_01285 [Fibrobacteria bacterium]|nr:hypothetical protein [Fibrobacteria bacterium]
MLISTQILMVTSLLAQAPSANAEFSMRYRAAPTPNGDTIYNFTIQNGSSHPLSWITLGANSEGRWNFSIGDSVYGHTLPGLVGASPFGWSFDSTYVDEEPVVLAEWKTKNHAAPIPPGGSQSGFGILIPKGLKTNIANAYFTFTDDEFLHFSGQVRPEPPLPTGQFVVSPSVSGSGKVQVSPSQTSYPNGSSVVLTPVASVGWKFVGWAGDTTSTTPSLSLTVTKNRFPTAMFQEVATPVDKPVLEVSTSDKTPTDTKYLRPKIVIKNAGTKSVSIGSVRFFYTPTTGKQSVAETWYAPKCEGGLSKVNQKDAYVLACKGVVLKPGESYPDASGEGATFGIHNADWSPRDRALDWSAAGMGAIFSPNPRVVVTDSTGTPLTGTAP